LYHSGRILVYALMGIAAGVLGGAVGKAAEAARVPGMLSILAGLLVVVAGLSYLGWLPFWRRSLHTGGWWQRMMTRFMKTPGATGVFMLGALNGLLPCGLVYEALIIAASAARPLVAGLGMLLFGAATIPTMVIFGVGAQMLSVPIRQKLVWVGGIFVVLVGIDLVLRGAAGLGLLPAMLN
jgi:sulfite exporter TauE/SafE